MNLLAAARTALTDGDWQRVLDLLEGEQSAETWELRARASYGAGEPEHAISAWERMHEVCVHAGDHEEAARAAAMTAMFLLIDTGLMAPVRGWLQRARLLLEGADPGPVHALVAAVGAYERLFCGDREGAAPAAREASDLGDRFGVSLAAVMGRTTTARLALLDGQVEEGLALLDEVGTRLMAGELDGLGTGMMLCEVICAAQSLGRHDLAQQWTDVMERWRPGHAVGGINGRCRVHRAELLRVTGPADAAEREALQACTELAPWMRREYGWPLVELGNIRLRKGDLVGAEAAFLAAHDLAWPAQPGLALLRLAQGDLVAARSLIEDAVAHPFPLPWKERPPTGELLTVSLLEAQAQISQAAGDRAACGAATERLVCLARDYPSPGLAARAAVAAARTALLEGDSAAAAAHATDAVAGWSEVGAPYDVAEARLLLADAHAEGGAAEQAMLERTAALHAFEAFGAVERAAETARLLGVPAAGPAVFRREGADRLVEFGGVRVQIPDLVGLRYVQRLLAAPGRDVHVLDLVAGERGEPGTPAQPGLPVLDEQARAAYRRRLAEVENDIEEAKEWHDLGRLELAERDRGFLIAELRRATGLGGRERTEGGDAERARTSVTRSVRYALGKLGQQHPDLAQHLSQSLSTGTRCRYQPDPPGLVSWETDD